jgi:hypothetical protein
VICTYLRGIPMNPNQPPGPLNPIDWFLLQFTLSLTPRQPTHWSVAQGRSAVPGDPPGSPGAGIDPGHIPAAPDPFIREMRCVQVDASDAPLGGNALTGAATLVGPSGAVSQYDAIGFRGIDVDGDNILRLDGVEYDACPAEQWFVHRADSPLGLPTVPVRTRLTVIPCNIDYEHQLVFSGAFFTETWDEFELRISAGGFVSPWNEFDADEVIGFRDFDDEFKLTRLIHVGEFCEGGPHHGAVCNDDGDCAPGLCRPVPLLAVMETLLTGAALEIDIQNARTDGGAPGHLDTVIPLQGP